jgi:hypothetical protein
MTFGKGGKDRTSYKELLKVCQICRKERHERDKQQLRVFLRIKETTIVLFDYNCNYLISHKNQYVIIKVIEMFVMSWFCNYG